MHTINATSARGGRLSLDLLGTVLSWLERRRQRLALARLDDRMLKDIGLSRAEVEVELSKPFWQG
jgi:uncharacterized protein YjiS (DUF1127 family)